METCWQPLSLMSESRTTATVEILIVWSHNCCISMTEWVRACSHTYDRKTVKTIYNKNSVYLIWVMSKDFLKTWQWAADGSVSSWTAYTKNWSLCILSVVSSEWDRFHVHVNVFQHLLVWMFKCVSNWMMSLKERVFNPSSYLCLEPRSRYTLLQG